MKFLLVLFLDMGSCSIARAGVQWCHHNSLQEFESSLANIMSFHLHKTKKKVKTNQIHAYSFALLEFSEYQLFHTTFFQLLEYSEITLFWSFITIFLLLINMLCQGKQFIILNDFGQKSYQ
uniref:Uncharacterized protein n=1 Tax=Macaca fascicularis TaxID=9541 RepID=A0A7N9CE33_MACFA